MSPAPVAHLSVMGRPTDATADLYPNGAGALTAYVPDLASRKTVRVRLDLSPDLVAFLRRRFTVAGSPMSERDQHVAIMRGLVEAAENAGVEAAPCSTADLRRLVDAGVALIAENAENVALTDQANEAVRRWEETVRGLTTELDLIADSRARLVAEHSLISHAAGRAEELARRHAAHLADIAVTVEAALADEKIDEALADRLLALADPIRLGPVPPAARVDRETALAELVDADDIAAVRTLAPVRRTPVRLSAQARQALTDRQRIGVDCLVCGRMGDQSGIVLAPASLERGPTTAQVRACAGGTGCDVEEKAEARR